MRWSKDNENKTMEQTAWTQNCNRWDSRRESAVSHCLTALDDWGLAEKDILILHSLHTTQRANQTPLRHGNIHQVKQDEVWLTGYHFLGLVGLHVAVVLWSDRALSCFGTRVQPSIEWVGVVGISHDWSWRNHLKQEQSHVMIFKQKKETQEIPFIRCNKLRINSVCWGMNERKSLYIILRQKNILFFSQTDSILFYFVHCGTNLSLPTVVIIWRCMA